VGGHSINCRRRIFYRIASRCTTHWLSADHREIWTRFSSALAGYLAVGRVEVDVPDLELGRLGGRLVDAALEHERPPLRLAALYEMPRGRSRRPSVGRSAGAARRVGAGACG
jgi:hypothetical protein